MMKNIMFGKRKLRFSLSYFILRAKHHRQNTAVLTENTIHMCSA